MNGLTIHQFNFREYLLSASSDNCSCLHLQFTGQDNLEYAMVLFTNEQPLTGNFHGATFKGIIKELTANYGIQHEGSRPMHSADVIIFWDK